MNKFSLGIFLGSLSGASWGLNTVIIGIILTFSIFIPYSENLFLSALVVAFLHDLCSSIWLLLNLIKIKKTKELIKLLKNKIGYFMIIASILGGPIGMAGYLLGVKYIGPSYTASFSALYPAVGTVLTSIILKDKINLRMKIGVLISGLGILILSYVPINLELYPHYILGIFFSFFCVFGWALECVIASYAMRYGEVDSSVAICLRQLTSAFFYGLVIIPFIKGYTLVKIILTTNTILFLLVTALIGSISYLCWYSSIDKIGAPRGMSLNITYVIWTIIFERLYFGTEVSLKFILASIVIVFGIVLIAGNPKEMMKSNKKLTFY